MPEEIIRRKRRLSSFQIIILGFAGVILLGALLLMLPQPASSSAEPITSPRASDISAIRRRVIWITRMVSINT